MKFKSQFILLLILLFSTTISVTRVSADEILDLKIKNKLLHSELALAGKSNIYFIFDLKNRKIYLKARGAALKEMAIHKVKLWNLDIQAKPLALLKKSTVFKPRRDKIKPQGKGSDATDKPEIDALELDDMPSGYTLKLENGVSVAVRSIPESLFSKAGRSAHSANWKITRPLITIWKRIFNKPFASVYLTMDKMDAKSLYWSFYEGSQCIIYNP